MRILFVHRESGQLYGGVENHIRAVSKLLAERGHKITIFTEKGEINPLAQLEKENNIKVIYCPSFKFLHSSNTKRIKQTVAKHVKNSFIITKALRVLSNLPWIIKSLFWVCWHRKEFDLVSVHKFIDTVVLQVLNKFIVLPFIESLEGYDFIEAENAKNVKFVTTISDFIRQMCVREHGFDPVLIPIGVDIEKFLKVDKIKVKQIRQKYCPNNELLILNVARLVESKDIPAMISAAAIINKKYKDVKFIVCGDGEERLRLEQMIMDLNLKDYFLLVKAFGDDLPPFYKAADIFVHVPRFGNHFGIVYVEALASGLPIIAANKEASPSTVGDAAILVEPERPDLLANALVKLIADKGLRATYSKEALKRAKSVFNWHKIIFAVESLYQKAATSDIYKA